MIRVDPPPATSANTEDALLRRLLLEYQPADPPVGAAHTPHHPPPLAPANQNGHHPPADFPADGSPPPAVSPRAVPGAATVPTPSPSMQQLRSILLTPEQQRIQQLEAEIARLNRQMADHEALIDLLSPVIAQAIMERVRESQDEMAEALYPVIGRSISKAVSEAMRDLARRIDTTMRQDIPQRIRQSLGFRLRGINPTEGALRQLFPFVVREIFLLHPESGLLICHQSYSGTLSDADLIGGMLTAIRSYVRDSFTTEGSLDAIDYGDLRILIEEGRLVVLAVVLQGIEPSGYHTVMRQQLLRLQSDHADMLRHYEGDMPDPDLVLPYLRPLHESDHAST